MANLNKTSILLHSPRSDLNETNLPEKKKKTVRFQEKTEFFNEKHADSHKEITAKGHLIVEDILKKEIISDMKFEKVKFKEVELEKNDYSDICNTNPLSNISSIASSFDSMQSQTISQKSSDANFSTISSDETILCEPDGGEESNETINKSCFEYESILFPKASKYVDYLSISQQNMSTVIEREEQDETLSDERVKKVSKKDKKIIKDENKGSEICHLTLMSLELHVNTRGNLTPNPELDPICFACFTIYEQTPDSGCLFNDSQFQTFFIINDVHRRSMCSTRFLNINTSSFLCKRIKKIHYVHREEDVLDAILKAVRYYDPDILIGFEMQKLSWSYLIRRAIRLNIKDFHIRISRIPNGKRESSVRINLNRRPTHLEIIPVPHEIVIAGRVMLNLWRILRSEISLNIYTLENCAFHILNERVMKYNYQTLTNWFNHPSDLFRWRVIEYYLYRTECNLKLLSSLNIINKTCEFARVYGIEFYHVLSRGSQYRVESMMLRIARKLNFIAYSANQKQKVLMRAPECIPLTMEPESRFYTDPVAILDFQSLYPSVIIGYNICFSTCLGRVESIGKEGSFKFGCGSLFVSDNLIKSLDLEKDVYIAPNGIAFVRKHIRQGILPVMLEDILKTRVMVKNSMKLYDDDENLLKIFDSRQLSLKLIANVTFGYTAANFSGRMPCVEVGDSIVRVARQALETSIKYVHSNQHRFNARVVYGDTDSLFVLFEKTKKSDAFKLSYKIVDEISNMFPKPVKLKFEKIYSPSILLAKKRYLGYMFETPEQAEPTLDVKGIEIIRRDGCQVSAKILERCCKILFEFKDVEKVRDYLLKQSIKLINGKINLKDFIIAKEYRGRDSYDNVKSVAACQIANKSLLTDPLAEPLTGERVPYVIVYGMPGVPLYELVRSPYELLENNELKLNYEYYIIKQILPPLDRIMCLINVNVFEWLKGVSFKPKVFQFITEQSNNSTSNNNNNTSNKTKRRSVQAGQMPVSLTSFIYSTDCVLCGSKRDTLSQLGKTKQHLKHGLCERCSQMDQHSLVKLRFKFQRVEKRFNNLVAICSMCTSSNSNMLNEIRMSKSDCCSLDCPNTFLLINAKQDLKKTDYIRKTIEEFF